VETIGNAPGNRARGEPNDSAQKEKEADLLGLDPPRREKRRKKWRGYPKGDVERRK
jgi:hypothetical protein